MAGTRSTFVIFARATKDLHYTEDKHKCLGHLNRVDFLTSFFANIKQHVRHTISSFQAQHLYDINQTQKKPRVFIALRFTTIVVVQTPPLIFTSMARLRVQSRTRGLFLGCSRERISFAPKALDLVESSFNRHTHLIPTFHGLSAPAQKKHHPRITCSARVQRRTDVRQRSP